MELRNEIGLDRSLHANLTAARASLAKELLACVESAAATVEQGSALGSLHPTDYARIRLRDCVRDFTEAMRSSGEHPEQALKSVKEVMADVAPGVESYSALAGDVSQWCIEAYFEPE